MHSRRKEGAGKEERNGALISCVIRRNVKRKLKPIDRLISRGLDNYVSSFDASTSFRIGPRTYLHNSYIESFQRELGRLASVTMRAKGCGAVSNMRCDSFQRIRDNSSGKLLARTKLLRLVEITQCLVSKYLSYDVEWVIYVVDVNRESVSRLRFFLFTRDLF